MDKQKILIVEDNRDVAGFLEFTVQSLGYEAIIAGDGIGALKFLHHTTPVMILLDMYLPDITGADILQHVRATNALQAVPVIVLTGVSHTLSREVKELANFTLIKPIEYHIISQLILRIAKSPPRSDLPIEPTTVGLML